MRRAATAVRRQNFLLDNVNPLPGKPSCFLVSLVLLSQHEHVLLPLGSPTCRLLALGTLVWKMWRMWTR